MENENSNAEFDLRFLGSEISKKTKSLKSLKSL